MPTKSNQPLFQRGDIFLVKFHPGYGSELQKYRPAIVVSDRISFIDSRFALIAPLTTNTKIMYSDSEFIIKNPALEKDSLLLCWYLWTIDASRLVRKLGVLHSTEQKKMTHIIRDLFI